MKREKLGKEEKLPPRSREVKPTHPTESIGPPLPCGEHQEFKLSFSSHRVGKNLTPMTSIHSILGARAMQLPSVVPPSHFPESIPSMAALHPACLPSHCCLLGAQCWQPRAEGVTQPWDGVCRSLCAQEARLTSRATSERQ